MTDTKFYITDPVSGTKCAKQLSHRKMVQCYKPGGGGQEIITMMIKFKFMHQYHTVVHQYHTVVCCAAQENGVRANRVSILTETTKSRFSRICSSVMIYPKWHQICSGVSLHEGEARSQILTRSLRPFPRYESAKSHKNFFIFFFVISHSLQKSP